MILRARLAAEAAGTFYLLAAVVGSGVIAERLAAGNAALALLANALATGAALLAILLTAGPVSGAHLNPAASTLLALRGELPPRALAGYVAAQLLGAIAGVIAAHAMFGLPLLETATKARPGAALVLSEAVATFGLLAVVLHARSESVAAAVAAYITAAYWFTPSTSFANPAVTLARTFTDTFTGIRAADAPGFLLGQALAVAAAALLFRRRT